MTLPESRHCGFGGGFGVAICAGIVIARLGKAKSWQSILIFSLDSTKSVESFCNSNDFVKDSMFSLIYRF